MTSNYEHPFFRPLWRRIAIVAACVAWSVLEYVGGSQTWCLIAGGMAAYGAYQFFYLYKPVEPEAAATSDPPAPAEPKE